MKKEVLLLLFAALTLGLFAAFVTLPGTTEAIPEDVEKILVSSCNDCHSNEASSKKAKLVLNFDSWDKYKDSKKISKLEKICEEVEEGKMPPEKYLKSKPEKVLDEQQKAAICKWTAEETEKLLGSGE